MIEVELTPEVVASLRTMSDRGGQPPRCHDGVIRRAIAGAVRILVEDGLSGGVRPWDLAGLRRRAAELGDVSAATAVSVDADVLVAELLPSGERIVLRGVDDGWRLVRFADGDDVSVRPESSRRVELHDSGPDAVLAALGVVKPEVLASGRWSTGTAIGGPTTPVARSSPKRSRTRSSTVPHRIPRIVEV